MEIHLIVFGMVADCGLQGKDGMRGEQEEGKDSPQVPAFAEASSFA